MEDFPRRIGGAIEEFVRHASPVQTFRRTCKEDYVLNGTEIKAGEWVATIFASGNRDDRVFENPNDFDITRSPNPHIGFGGGGPHFCMGNFVAKMQLREIFDNLLHRAPNLEVGEPEFLVGNFVHAVKSMPYRLA
jgi:cytochrome P450